MKIGKVRFPKLRFPKIKFARTPVALAAAFVIFSLVLSIASPKLRIATSGGLAPQWGADGRVISDLTDQITGHDIAGAQLVPSDNGGYISIFQTETQVENAYWKAQKFNANGERQWGPDGIDVVASLNESTDLEMAEIRDPFLSVSDGAGGAYFVGNAGDRSARNLVVQRIIPDGTLHFPSPVALATTGTCVGGSLFSNDRFGSSITEDGAGGFIITWRGSGWPNPDPACAQRIDPDGNRLWGDAAIIVPIDLTNGVYGALTSDGAGGAIIETSNGVDIVIHHFNGDGNEASGCPQTIYHQQGNNSIGASVMVADGSGGAVAVFGAWSEVLRAMHVSGSCVADPNWPVNGIEVSGEPAPSRWNYIRTALTPNGVAFIYSDAPGYPNNATNVTVANMISLADGTSVWGGERSLGTVSINSPVVSGGDLLYLMTNSRVRKLNGATGADDPAFGASGIPSAPESAGVAAISDGNGGIVAVNVSFYASIQHMASDGTLLWPADDNLVDQQFISWLVPDSPFSAAAPSGDKAVFWVDDYENLLFVRRTAKIQIYGANGQAKLPAGGSVFFDSSRQSYYFDPFYENQGNSGIVGIFGAAADANGYYALMYREGAGFVQKFDLNGAPLWGTNGAPVANPFSLFTGQAPQAYSDIIPDGSGGAYTLTLFGTQMMVDHFASDGSSPWGHAVMVGSDVNIVNGWANPFRANIVQDGAGGAYAEWTAVVSGDSRVLISRIDNTGAIYPQFAVPGLAVSPPGEGDSSYGLVSDGAGNAITAYIRGDGEVYAQKIGPDGTFMWGAVGKPLYGSGSGAYFDSENGLNSMASDGSGGLVQDWSGSDGLDVQRLDATGEAQWGTVAQTTLTADIFGGEDTVAVSDTTGFGSTGSVKIGDSYVQYTGTTPSSFTGCTNTPSATSGAAVTQRQPFRLGDWGGHVLAGDNGGAAFLTNEYNTIYLHRMDAAGIDDRTTLAETSDPNISFSAPIIAGGNDSFLAIWNRTDYSNVYTNGSIHGQFMAVSPASPPAHAPGSGGGGVTTPVINAPVGNGNANGNNNSNNNSNTPSNSPIEQGTTDATYHFTNPGGATSFNLYDAPPASSLRLLASNSDPNATSVTETSLTPNTTYSNRVITAVANGSESSPSPSFPTFATLLNNFDSITASYDPIAKTVSFSAAGNLQNLTTGQSGADFVISTPDGKPIFDSGFLQTPSLGSLSAVDLEPGETYTVTVTPRNQNGDLSPSEDFTVTIPALTGTQAKITLTKTAQKIDYPSSSAALTNGISANTKEIRYSIVAANTGTGIAKTFVMTDPLPEGIDFKVGSLNVVSDLDDPDDVVNASYDPSSRTITATIRELEPNESFTVIFVVTPASGTASSTVKNKASASWSE